MFNRNTVLLHHRQILIARFQTIQNGIVNVVHVDAGIACDGFDLVVAQTAQFPLFLIAVENGAQFGAENRFNRHDSNTVFIGGRCLTDHGAGLLLAQGNSTMPRLEPHHRPKCPSHIDLGQTSPHNRIERGFAFAMMRLRGLMSHARMECA